MSWQSPELIRPRKLRQGTTDFFYHFFCARVLTRLYFIFNTRKTFVRCALASDALNTLRKCLGHFPEFTGPATNDLSTTPILLRSLIRDSIPSELILEFLTLGYLLEEELVIPRLYNVTREYANLERNGAIIDARMFETTKIFDVWERRLW